MGARARAGASGSLRLWRCALPAGSEEVPPDVWFWEGLHEGLQLVREVHVVLPRGNDLGDVARAQPTQGVPVGLLLLLRQRVVLRSPRRLWMEALNV